ncbi:hypothetical protein HA402_006882 [Bradysia odoriphaga]|nr:hypothetical protein HA402_006882 [Bradysia odoriphaga]
MDNVSKSKAGMFSGSAPFEYNPSQHLEAGISQSRFHSITAMSQYQNASFEELRMEDYSASDGIFGSKIAKLGASLCNDRPGVKLTPHQYGTLFKDAIKSFKNENHSDSASSPAVPVNVLKGEHSFPNVNLSFQGQKNVTVYINGDSNVNFSFSVESHKPSLSKSASSKSSSSKSSSSKSSRSKSSRSKSYDRVDRKKLNRASGNVKKSEERVTDDTVYYEKINDLAS